MAQDKNAIVMKLFNFSFVLIISFVIRNKAANLSDLEKKALRLKPIYWVLSRERRDAAKKIYKNISMRVNSLKNRSFRIIFLDAKLNIPVTIVISTSDFEKGKTNINIDSDNSAILSNKADAVLDLFIYAFFSPKPFCVNKT